MIMNVALVIVFCPSFVRRPKGDLEGNAFNHLLYKGHRPKKRQR